MYKMNMYLALNNANNEVVFETTSEDRKVFKVFAPSNGAFDGIDLYPTETRTIEDIVRELKEYCFSNTLNGFWDMPGDLIEDENFLDNYQGEIHFICEVE